MSSHQFVVSIMGNLSQDFLKSLIKMTDNKLSNLDVNTSIKQRVFHFMVECAQNLCKIDQDNKSVNNSLFLIGKKGEEYSVYLGSVFRNEETTDLISTINKVNNIDPADLKENFYNEILKNKSGENQLLMSLMDLYKRTKEKIHYDEFPLDAESKFVSFKITLSNK